MSGKSEKTAIMLADVMSQSLHSINIPVLCATYWDTRHLKCKSIMKPAHHLIQEYQGYKKDPDLDHNITRNMEKYSQEHSFKNIYHARSVARW